jgi:hypothetical protein
VFREQLRRQARQHFERRQEGGFLFDDAMNGKIADGEFEAHGNVPGLQEFALPH